MEFKIKIIDEAHSKKAVTYINVYKGDAPIVTRKDADRLANGSDEERIACIRVEFEEGRFDE